MSSQSIITRSRLLDKQVASTSKQSLEARRKWRREHFHAPDSSEANMDDGYVISDSCEDGPGQDHDHEDSSGGEISPDEPWSWIVSRDHDPCVTPHGVRTQCRLFS